MPEHGARSIDRPIFIVGCGRSGTTLLYDLVARHRDLAWFSNLSQRSPSTTSIAALSRLFDLRATRRLVGRVRYLPHPAEGHAIFDRVRGHSDNGILAGEALAADERDRLRAVVADHVRFQGKRRFLNKNTGNARRVGYLRAAFPDACFVHVVRDPRSTVASLLRVAFWPDLPIWWCDERTPRQLEAAGEQRAAIAAEFWKREVDAIDGSTQALPRASFLEVRYEEMVADAAETVHDVVHLAGLGPDPKLDRKLGELRVEDRSRGYRSVLSDDEVMLVDAITADVAARHGYAVGSASTES